ncbi:inositol monophosphatase family protein [Nakamurella leprariae]|uniref:Inositol-1-monophosphatase n=1 Tax=Nakamurella leprariae TaxID=2803911 RepID=A0A938YEZ0_9ACTN|nr:inositol monophosphatase family protein [Nakamurella leprariae]MBM9466548.1 inositol monophosphatase [Nakamurella leprariae]
MTGTDPTVDPAALLDLAVRGARLAATELVSRYGRVGALRTKSTVNDPVSEADLASEAVLVELITTERPQDGLLGEEGTDRPSSSGLRWVIDPLDGTVNYLYRLDNFCVSVAVEDSSGPVAGAVFDPVADRLYAAVRGGGATLNGDRLQVNDPVPLDRALLGTGFGYSSGRRAWQGAITGAMLPVARDIRRIGSAALDLCHVADGTLDGYFEIGLQPWDGAAGMLVVTEAGGVVATRPERDPSDGSSPVRYLAAGPTLHPALTATLDRVIAEVAG